MRGLYVLEKMNLFGEQARERTAAVIAPGAVWLKQWLSLDEQRALVERCRALMDGPAGGYMPTVRGGGKMRVRMMCLGRHWNPLTYTYDDPCRPRRCAGRAGAGGVGRPRVGAARRGGLRVRARTSA